MKTKESIEGLTERMLRLEEEVERLGKALRELRAEKAAKPKAAGTGKARTAKTTK